jgi:hypothetical protein
MKFHAIVILYFVGAYAGFAAALAPAKPAYSADLILSPPGDVHVDSAHLPPPKK